MKEQNAFFLQVQRRTEAFLSWSKRRNRIKREKQKAKHPLVDWLEAFLWAAGYVLLLNQYLFQAYVIPSGSMIDTLLIQDRIFVNKLIYGPELLPGVLKFGSPIKVGREDVIIFENPDYESRGTLFDIAQRVIFMLTFSLVNIDRDKLTGEPLPHLLIKRAVAMGGDTVRFVDGELYIRFAGEDRWVAEREHIQKRGFKHNLNRLLHEEDYIDMRQFAHTETLAELGISGRSTRSLKNYDPLAYYQQKFETAIAMLPQDESLRNRVQRMRLGTYIGENMVLPLGDNRDNSHDGRYFGPIRQDKVLGRALLKFWPLYRIGGIR